MIKQKKYFLKSQIFAQTYAASVGHNKVYLTKKNDKQKDEMFNFLFDYLEKIVKPKYKLSVSHDAHLREIISLSDLVTRKYAEILYNGRYRIGTAQKLLNLYLKYMWCLGEIAEPPHMPVDRIILDKLRKLWKTKNKSKDNLALKINWTELDSIKIYENIISTALQLVNQSLSNWELEIWNSR
jgi:hypothetical protein